MRALLVRFSLWARAHLRACGSLLQRVGWRWVLLLPLVLLWPHAAGWWPYGAITSLDRAWYDLELTTLCARKGADSRIVIVDIDEASLRQWGRWPWSRDVMARLATELLQRQKASVLGLDIVFAEPEGDTVLPGVARVIAQQAGHNPALQTLSRRLQAEMDHDAALVRALQHQPVVMGAYFEKEGASTMVPPPAARALPVPASAQVLGADWSHVPAMRGYTGSVSGLRDMPFGALNAWIDPDGTLRHIPLVMRHVDAQGVSRFYPSLALAMLQRALPAAQVQVALSPADGASGGSAHLAGVRLSQGADRLWIPSDDRGAMLVPFRGEGGAGAGHFRYIGAADILAGRLPPGSLAGRMVIVGTSVPGLRDLRATPFDRAYPGMEVHASALAAMLDGRFLVAPDYANAWSVLWLLLLSGGLWWGLAHAGALRAWFVTLACAAVVVGAQVALFRAGLVLPLAASLVLVVSMYVLHTLMAYLHERRARARLVTLFGHYVPPELVKEMDRQPQSWSLQAQSREMTVMFCDIQNFTAMAEEMAPEEVQRFLNGLFNRMAGVIARHRGTIDKYIGDCVMVFWGAPLPDPDHANHAVHTALELQALMGEYNTQRARQGRPLLRLSIGTNTGIMRVGDMGSDLRRNYTVLGDAVNLAARLEPCSKQWEQPLIVGPDTAAAATDFLWQWVDDTHVTGRNRMVELHAPWAPTSAASAYRTQRDLWQQYQSAWRAQHWNSCQTLLTRLLREAPDHLLYRLHAERLHAMRVSAVI